MKTTTIYPPVEIFDDPEYCEDSENECEQLSLSLGTYCYTFDGAITTSESDRHVKCQQCKDLYQKANNANTK